MNAFQPIVASAVEVSRAANLVGTKKAQSLAAYAMEATEKVINRMAPLPPSPEIFQKLALFKTQLDKIRCSIEKMPKRPENKLKLFIGHVLVFDRETQRLKSELKRISKALLKSTVDDSSTGMVDGISRGDCILELVSFSIDAASAVCDAPVLNFLKPIIGTAAMIRDTVKSVKSNREVALGLAKHSSMVTKCLVDHATTHGVSVASNKALVALKSALGDIQSYLTALQKPRHRLVSWIIVNHEKDRTVQLNRALDEALALFTSVTAASTDAKVTTLFDLHRESMRDVTQMLASIHADLARVGVIGQDRDNWGFRGASAEAGTSRVSGETTHRGSFNQNTSPINIVCSTDSDH